MLVLNDKLRILGKMLEHHHGLRSRGIGNRHAFHRSLLGDEEFIVGQLSVADKSRRFQTTVCPGSMVKRLALACAHL